MFRRKILVIVTLLGAAGVSLWLCDPYVAEFPSAVTAYYYRRKYGVMLLTLLFEAFTVTAVLLGLLHARRSVRWVFLILFSSVTAFHSGYSSVLKRPLQLFDLEVLQQEAAQAGNALQAYQGIYGSRIWVFFALALGSAAIARCVAWRFARGFYLCAPLALLVCAISFTHNDRFRAVGPSIFTVPALYLRNSFSGHYHGPRDPVALQPPRQRRAEKLVLVVDESIRGDMLSINGAAADTTPLLRELPFLNFGIASSATNCSATTHLVLRTGLLPQQLPERENLAFTLPSLFQYAKHAGYRTVLVDGQRRGGNLQDYLTRYDLENIDEFAYLNEDPVCRESGDCFVNEVIGREFSRPGPVFIYAIKEGAHIPYQKNHPAERTVFSPALQPGEGFSDRQRTLNSYFNAIRWVVDHFLASLMPQLKSDGTLLIYTSDHGQNIVENGYHVTHCSKINAAPPEGNVPLLLAGDAAVLKRFAPSAKAKKNHATHFEIFPTLLRMMGYRPREVRKLYGASLLDRRTVPQRFYSGNLFGRSEFSWNGLDNSTFDPAAGGQ